MTNAEGPIIFVSCGQYTNEERLVGEGIARIITEETPATGYFAQNESSFEGVSDHILKALGRAVGFVGVLHHRGNVSALEPPPFFRASVWVEQEIAIAAYLVQNSRRPIPVQLYIEEGIRLEGLREKVMLNAMVFRSNEDVLAHFRHNVKTIFATLPTHELQEEERRLQSPLGQKPFPAVSLTPSAINPEFILGARIRPYSYLDVRHVIDDKDEKMIEGVGHRSRGKLGKIHEHLSLRRIGDGMVLETPDPNERRQDNSPIRPAQQVEVDSDGDITIRFAQNDNHPLFQYLTVVGTAYCFLRDVYPHLGLVPKATVEVVLQLHAGRQQHSPALPGHFMDRAVIDARTDDFVSAFTDLTLQLFRAANFSSSREDVRETLERFCAEHMPDQPTDPQAS